MLRRILLVTLLFNTLYADQNTQEQKKSDKVYLELSLRNAVFAGSSLYTSIEISKKIGSYFPENTPLFIKNAILVPMTFVLFVGGYISVSEQDWLNSQNKKRKKKVKNDIF